MRIFFLSFFLLIAMTMSLSAQIIKTEGDYFIIPEKDNMRFEFWDEYVSYDMEMNLLGKIPWHSYIRQIVGEKNHIIVLHRPPNDAGRTFVTIYDPSFKILQKQEFKGTVEDVMTTDDFFILKMRDRYWGPINLVSFNWDFEELGRIKQTKFIREVHLGRNHIILKESNGKFRSRYYLRSYDSTFKLVGERERKHESY